MAEAAATGRALGFFQRLPKVELHAHLNGSISDATMKKLMAQKPDLGIQKEMVVIDKGTKRTLEECFQMFQFIHQMTSRPEDILMVTKDVIREFAADGVKYLELRSTPREEKSTGMTKRTYLEAVLEGIKQCKEEGLDIDVSGQKQGGSCCQGNGEVGGRFFALHRWPGPRSGLQWEPKNRTGPGLLGATSRSQESWFEADVASFRDSKAGGRISAASGSFPGPNWARDVSSNIRIGHTGPGGAREAKQDTSRTLSDVQPESRDCALQG